MVRSISIFIAGLIAGSVLLLLAGMLGWLGSNATAEPPNWEMSIGMRALDASLEKRSAGLRNPIAGNDAILAGRKLYAMNCSGCEGSEPMGEQGLLPPRAAILAGGKRRQSRGSLCRDP